MQTENRLSPEIAPDTTDVPAWLETALAVPREEGWLNSGDTPIHYFRWGDPKKPPILMLHGFLAHSRCFGFIAPLLARDYHVIAYDFSGMGDSGVRDFYPESVRVAELLDVARETGLFESEQKPTLIAHSYGGNVGLATMEEHADLFAGLVLCDVMTLRPQRLLKHFEHSGPPGSQDPKRKNRIYPDYETAKARFVLSPPQEVAEPVLFDYMAFHSLKEVEGGWTWKFDPSVFNRETDHRQQLMAQGQRIVNAPGRKALVYGENSLLFDNDSADYVKECGGGHIPMIGIPGAAHHLMLDQPIAFGCVLKTILAEWQCD